MMIYKCEEFTLDCCQDVLSESSWKMINGLCESGGGLLCKILVEISYFFLTIDLL